MKYFNKYFYETDFITFQNLIKNNSYIIRKVKYEDNKVSFYSNALIDNDYIKRTNCYQKFLKKYVISNLLFILSMVLVIVMFINSGKDIKELKYAKNSIQDEQVYQHLYNEVIKSTASNEKKIDLNQLSKQTLIIFPHYAFIELRKEGSILFIKIEQQDIIRNKFTFSDKPGNFLSAYDAYIKSIIIESGFVVIDVNQVVKKNQLLVSGNLLYGKNDGKHNYYTTPKGIIIGNVIQQKEYVINKKCQFSSYNGKINVYNEILLFGKKVKKSKSKYAEKKTTKLFSIFNIIEFNKIVEYDRSNYEYQYSLDNIEEYLKSLINNEFEKNRVSELEHINEIKIIKIEENDTYFKITTLENKDLNIVSFQEIS